MHDYHNMSLVCERLNTARKNLEKEGKELSELLTKYFLDIFDSKVKFLKSDMGQHRYTDYITKFANTHSINHKFSVMAELPGISR